MPQDPAPQPPNPVPDEDVDRPDELQPRRLRLRDDVVGCRLEAWDFDARDESTLRPEGDLEPVAPQRILLRPTERRELAEVADPVGARSEAPIEEPDVVNRDRLPRGDELTLLEVLPIRRRRRREQNLAVVAVADVQRQGGMGCLVDVQSCRLRAGVGERHGERELPRGHILTPLGSNLGFELRHRWASPVCLPTMLVPRSKSTCGSRHSGLPAYLGLPGATT